MKILKYSFKKDQEKQETELREIQKQFSEFNLTDFLKNENIYPNIEKLKEIKQKLEEAEKLKKILENFKEIAQINENIYDVWFYYQPDMYNNGGTKTQLNRQQLEHLIKRGNEITNVYFVKILDLNASFVKGEEVIPDFLSDDIKCQLDNKDYNSWHKQLLSR